MMGNALDAVPKKSMSSVLWWNISDTMGTDSGMVCVSREDISSHACQYCMHVVTNASWRLFPRNADNQPIRIGMILARTGSFVLSSWCGC